VYIKYVIESRSYGLCHTDYIIRSILYHADYVIQSISYHAEYIIPYRQTEYNIIRSISYHAEHIVRRIDHAVYLSYGVHMRYRACIEYTLHWILTLHTYRVDHTVYLSYRVHMRYRACIEYTFIRACACSLQREFFEYKRGMNGVYMGFERSIHGL